MIQHKAHGCSCIASGLVRAIPAELHCFNLTAQGPGHCEFQAVEARLNSTKPMGSAVVISRLVKLFLLNSTVAN